MNELSEDKKTPLDTNAEILIKEAEREIVVENRALIKEEIKRLLRVREEKELALEVITEEIIIINTSIETVAKAPQSFKSLTQPTSCPNCGNEGREAHSKRGDCWYCNNCGHPYRKQG